MEGGRAFGSRVGDPKMMKKRALGAAIAAAGIIGQCGFAAADPASDKLDLVLKRLEAIEQNNAKLARENAALRDRLNRVDKRTASTTVAGPAMPPGSSAQSTATAPAAAVPANTGAAYAMTPPPAKAASVQLDGNGHYYLEKKVGDPLTFYTPGGEITAYGNIDVSLDATSKDVRSLTLNGATPPVGNFGWMPAVSTNLSYLGVRGFQRIDSIQSNFVYQL